MSSTTTDTNQDISGVNVKVTTSANPPPLVNFQVANPIIYLKAWWKKIIGNEGIKMTIQIKPVTAFMLAFIFCGAGFGFGRLTVPAVFYNYLYPSPTPTSSPQPSTSPSADQWKDTALTGKVQFTNNQYFLVTTSAEAVTLTVPATINLKPLIGKRLLVAGKYNKTTKVMIVSDVTSLEVLPSSPVPVPTIMPSPTPP